jgi:hypothetical protein
MKLLFVAACLLGTTAIRAQTVLPSGAVAPTGAITPAGTPVTPGTVPGAQPLNTLDRGGSGSARGHRRTDKIPGLSREDRKELRKLNKVRPKGD